MQAAVVLTHVIRTCDYRRFEDQSRSCLDRRYPVPTIEPSPAEDRRRSLSPLLDAVHQKASRAQTVYHNSVVRSAGSLALAFTALALGTLPSEFWPLQIPNWSRVELMLSWIEIVAMTFVLALFLRGNASRRPWIRSRAGTELLRQYQVLDMVFPNATTTSLTNNPDESFEIEAERVKTQVQDDHKRSDNDIAARIEKFWIEKRNFIETFPIAQADLTGDALLAYIRRRARRQLGWFTNSKVRLEHIAGRRTSALVGLYCLAILLAVTKHVLIVLSVHIAPCLVPPLLIATGISAAMTAYYINQNSRSLIHRYNTQQRAVRRWMDAFTTRWDVAALPAVTFTPIEKDEIRAEILRFVRPIAVSKFPVTFDEWDTCAQLGDCDAQIGDSGTGTADATPA